jgi:hypothetical protein
MRTKIGKTTNQNKVKWKKRRKRRKLSLWRLVGRCTPIGLQIQGVLVRFSSSHKINGVIVAKWVSYYEQELTAKWISWISNLYAMTSIIWCF